MFGKIRYLLKWLVYRMRGTHTTEELVKAGLRVGRNFVPMVGTIIDPAHCHHIVIGDDVTLAPRVHILAHDASLKHHTGYVRVANVNIGNRVFIGADSVVMPGVNIGDDVIVGANSTVTRSVPPRAVVAGAPARMICTLDEFLARHREAMKTCPVFGEEYSMRSNPPMHMRREMYDRLSDGGDGYIV